MPEHAVDPDRDAQVLTELFRQPELGDLKTSFRGLPAQVRTP
jgi:hypothetical protein